ncbi:MAG: ribosome small subunit-dependent GTPase A [Verrucomicrobia bacterium]|nr:ribosome small subunit-dependent GTPase A [Verrucomicrobiota bacterium]
MTLEAYGFEPWFRDRSQDLLLPGQGVARVLAVDRGAFVIRGEHGVSTAQLSGKIRYDTDSSPELPCVGDWVCVDIASPTLAIIHAVLERRTALRRKRPGKSEDFQMIATNLDVAFVVQSCHFDFNLARLDRYLAMVHEGGITPVIILSKIDLVAPEELQAMIDRIRDAGITAQLIPLSNATGRGLDELRDLLVPRQTFCLVGSSGVGKTTLVNRLLGRDEFDTRSVSDTGEGVHTTSRRQLLMLPNGAMLIDTPGMRELGVLGAGDGVEDSFADIEDLSRTCRFSNCSHTQEPGCAVRDAIDSGELNEHRRRSYMKLKKETDYRDLSTIQKRKRDKQFGKLYKSVMKHKRERDRPRES